MTKLSEILEFEEKRPEAEIPSNSKVSRVKQCTSPELGGVSLSNIDALLAECESILPEITKVEKNLLEAGAGYLDDEGKFHHNNEGMEYKKVDGPLSVRIKAPKDMLVFGIEEDCHFTVQIYLQLREMAKNSGGKLVKAPTYAELAKRNNRSERTIKKHIDLLYDWQWVWTKKGKLWIRSLYYVCDLMDFDPTIVVDLTDAGGNLVLDMHKDVFKAFCLATYQSDRIRARYYKPRYRSTDQKDKSFVSKTSTELRRMKSDDDGTRTRSTGEWAISLTAKDLNISTGEAHRLKALAIENGFIERRHQFCQEFDACRVRDNKTLQMHVKYSEETGFIYFRKWRQYRKRLTDLITSRLVIRKTRVYPSYLRYSIT